MNDRRDRHDRRIPELLAEHGPATVPDLAERLDTHPLTVERRCAELQRTGRIRQDTGGRYTTCDASRRDAMPEAE